MALDGLFLNRILLEMEPTLMDAKINRVHQPNANTITLKLNSRFAGNRTLLITAHPQNARIHFTGKSYDNPKTPPLFAMVLRKHIEGGRIIGVTQLGIDRVADISIEARNEIGDIATLHLMVEIMGKHSNIILCNKEMTILAAIKQYGSGISRYRQVLPHEPYIQPPPTNKLNPFLMDEEEFSEKLFSADLDLPISKALLQTMEGISPQTASELVFRCSLKPDFALNEAGNYEITRLFQEMQRLIHMETDPTLVFLGNVAKDFYYAPLLHYEGELKTKADLGDALDDFFVAKENKNAFSSKKANLLKIIVQHRDKTALKVMKQKKELSHAVDGGKYRLYGELLSAHLYQVEDHVESVDLEDFYHENEIITIPLQRELTAAENAGRYFKRYNKAKSSRNSIREHLKENEAELAYLESLCFQCEDAANDDDLAETRSELTHGGYLKEKHRANRGNKEKNNAPLPPMEVTYQGYTILIGRNNKQNDRLTLKTAQKDDLWLHTKNIPGSHVIIRRIDGREFPEEVIAEAAAYAAFHSRAKHSPKVEVDYTEVKQVKKPNGAKPGMVIYFEQTTIMVKPKSE